MADNSIALQVRAPDVMGAYNQGVQQRIGVDKAKMDQAEHAMQLIGAASMHALGGKLDGTPDPQKYEEGLDMLEGMGIPKDEVAKFRGKPQLAPIAARASMTAMQQLQAAQNEQEMNFALKKFETDVSQFGDKMALERDQLAVTKQRVEAGDVPSGYQKTPNGLAPIAGGPADPTNPLNTKKVTGPNLSATAQKELFEADEGVQAGNAVVSALDHALELNDKAYSGLMAGSRGYAGSLVGLDNANATEELNNLITSQALDQLKQTFGGMPTEGERKILLDIQGSVNQAPEVRKRIYERAKAAAERRIKFATSKAERLRSGEYFSESPGDAPAPQADGSTASPGAVTRAPLPDAAPTGEVSNKEQYDALPSGAEFTSGGKRYRKP